MQSIVIRDAIQAIFFGIVLTFVNHFNGRISDINLLAKNFVIYTVVFFALSILIDVLFKRNRK